MQGEDFPDERAPRGDGVEESEAPVGRGGERPAEGAEVEEMVVVAVGLHRGPER